MSRATKTVQIKASLEDVFGYVSDVKNHPAFIDVLKSVSDLSGDSKSGDTTWAWTFDMAGVELQGMAKTKDVRTNEFFSFETEGGIKSVFSYAMSPTDDGTTLTMEVQYEIPQNVLLAGLAAAAVEKVNQEACEKAAENLKTILES